MQLACPGLSAAFAAGSIILTPTPLLASVANEQFSRAQLAGGHATWRSPRIFSLQAWLVSCWQEARYSRPDVPALLSPAQERAVWQSLIEAEHPALFDPRQAGQTAISASRQLAEWEIPSEGEPWLSASDTRHFQRLLRLFQTRARQQNWITRSDLWDAVAHWETEQPVALTAFSVVSPGAQKFASAAAVPVQYGRRTKRAPLYIAGTLDDELEKIARWARHRFEANPGTSIGILVPELFAHKHQVERMFREVFYSSSLGVSPEHSVFHLHAPEPLSNHPIIASALLLLQLALPRIPIAQAGAILRSPFLSQAVTEQNERALADLHLRRNRDLDVTLSDLERSSAKCPQLSKTWDSIRRLLQSAGHSQELAGWSEFMGQLLGAAGWPGDRDMSSHENEIVEAWKAALTELAAVGFISGPVPYPVALQQLDAVIASRSTETGDLSSPIQILDAAQAYGLSFQYVAIANLTEEVWPPAVRPSPFIPLQLQRPYLNAQFDARQRTTEALFQSAPEIVACHTGTLAPSAIPFVEKKSTEPLQWSGTLLGHAPPALNMLASVDDSAAPPFVTDASTVQGGVSILKSQSQCPFQAFAKYRLSANRPEDACFGFDARERGSFLHRALEQVWLQLKTRDVLRSTAPEDLSALVRTAVDSAVRDQSDSPFHSLAGLTERERLEEVILEWLAIEASREQPFTVEQVEKNQTVTIAGLPLNLRLDRVDRLRNSELVLIDYKSGEPKIKSLEGDRPSEPQLLVYAAAIEGSVDGIFFAQMKPRKLRAIGYSHSRHFPSRSNRQACVKPDWDEFLDQAKDNVETIAGEFMHGWAAVDPQKGACTYCNLKPFCRVNEAGNSGEDIDDAD